MNNSIVDYLNSKGQASDYGSRSVLASQNGISNYSGSSDQNIQLLNTLRAKAPADASKITTPTNNYSMGAISVDQMKKENPIQTVTVPQDTTNYGSMTGAITKSVMDSYKTANDDYNTYATSLKSDAKSISDMLKTLTNKEADTQSANETAGVNTANAEYAKYIQQLAELNGQATSLNREAQAIPIQGQQDAEGKGITDAGLAPLTAAQLRGNALKALSIGQQTDVAQAAATGSLAKLNLAKEKAQQIIDLKYKPLEADLEARKQQYELNKDMLSLIDKKRTEALGVALDNEKTQMQAKKDLDTQISQIQIEAAKNGAPSDAISRIGNSASMKDAIANASIYLQTPNTDIVKLGDDRAYLVDKRTGKIIQSFGGGSGGGGSTGSNNNIRVTTTDANGNQVSYDLNGIVDTILGSGSFTKQQSADIRRAISQGQDPITVIRNQGKNLLSGANQTKLENAEKSLTELESLDKNMKAYYAAGGDTGIFTGTYENTINKLGEVKDPKLVELAARIATNLQEYRNQISGTAYGIKEGAEIASVFPSIKKGQILNNALVVARKDGLNAVIDGYYKSVLGDKGLALIKGAVQQTQAQTTSANIPKGNMSDRDYVEKVLTSRGLGGKYDQVYNSLLDRAKAEGYKQPMPVIDNASGQYGYIEYSDYLANKTKYTPL